MKNTKQDCIKSETENGNFYTAKQVSEFFLSEKFVTYSLMADEGSQWFHPVEYNSNGIGTKVGDNSWCDKFVFAIPVGGNYFAMLKEMETK